MINLSCKVIACGIILSSVKLEKKVQHSENDIRISHNLLSPSPSLSKNYCIHSFWSQNTEKRNNAIPQMRLRSKQQSSDLSPLSLPKTIVFIPSRANTQKKEIMPYPRCGFGASSSLLTSPPYPSKTIAFIPSGAKTQKKEIMPYPRCGFGACLRCG